MVESGVLRSDVTYDAIHVWKGRIFRLDDHIARFRASIAGLKTSLPHSWRQHADPALSTAVEFDPPGA